MSEARTHSLVIGHEGQDGRILREMLDAQGHSWTGIDRDSNTDVAEFAQVRELIAAERPQRLFYLAAAHRSASETADAAVFDSYNLELRVNVQGVINCLEAIRQVSPDTRLVFASSSLVFAPAEELLVETSIKAPAESYAIEKLLAGQACAAFREQHGLHASVAYLFNHESPYRRPGFFSRHVTDSIRAILAGEREDIEIGNPDAIVDWSCARDVVRAMMAIGESATPDDYVVASGEAHSVREFLDIAFAAAGLEVHQYLCVNSQRIQRSARRRIGDSSKLRKATGWHPKRNFQEMVTDLTRHALEPDEAESC